MILEIVIAFALMIGGYALYVLFKRYTAGHWNGYVTKATLIVGAILMLIISILTVVVPEVTDLLKVVTGLDLMATKVGFITLGVGLAGMVRNSKKDASQ